MIYRNLVAIGFAALYLSACGVGLEQPEPTEPSVECTTSAECAEGQVCVDFECKNEAVDDDDRDGVTNTEDNCPEIFNPEQSDQDGDNIGDACDTDRDNDSIDDDEDNCIDIPNPDQTDIDQDNIGDLCDDELPAPCNCTELQTCDETTGTCIEPTTCVTHADCTEGRVCLGGECVAAPDCVTNADCGENEYCDAAIQECAPEGCTTDSQCPAELVCAEEGYCGSCSTSTPCPGNQQCLGGTCFDAPECTTDADCTMGRVCDAGSCKVESCSDDIYEPNNGVDFVNNFIEANGPIGTGTYDFALCTDDPSSLVGEEDWFEIDAGLGDGFIINALIDLSQGTTEMYLINASGIQINGATQQGSYLTINVPALEEAPVYVQFLQFESIDAPVSMELVIIDGGYCLDDSWEPNNIGAGAHTVGADPVTTFKDFSLCPGDEDWFSLSVSAGHKLEIDMTTETGNPASIEVFAGGYEDIDRVARDNTSNTPKHIELNPESDTNYWVRVLQDDGSEGRGEIRFNVTE